MSIMELRKVLNKLTEEELELIKSKIDNELGTEINAVIDLKNAPSLFAMKYKVGDVYMADTISGRVIYKITNIDNPFVFCERIGIYSTSLDYAHFAQYSVDDFEYWTKIDSCIWGKLRTIIEKRNKDIEDIRNNSLKTAVEVVKDLES